VVRSSRSRTTVLHQSEVRRDGNELEARTIEGHSDGIIAGRGAENAMSIMNILWRKGAIESACSEMRARRGLKGMGHRPGQGEIRWVVDVVVSIALLLASAPSVVKPG
jgi:hypothetical protein